MSTNENKTETDGEGLRQPVSVDIPRGRIVIRGELGGYDLSFDDLCTERLNKVVDALNYAYYAGVRHGAGEVDTAAGMARKTVINAAMKGA